MNLRHFVYLGFAIGGAFAAFRYLRCAIKKGVKTSEFSFKEFMKNDADIQENSGINLFLFGIFAALSSIALLFKAFGYW